MSQEIRRPSLPNRAKTPRVEWRRRKQRGQRKWNPLKSRRRPVSPPDTPPWGEDTPPSYPKGPQRNVTELSGALAVIRRPPQSVERVRTLRIHPPLQPASQTASQRASQLHTHTHTRTHTACQPTSQPANQPGSVSKLELGEGAWERGRLSFTIPG